VNSLAEPLQAAAGTLSCPLCLETGQRNLAEFNGKFLRKCLHCGGRYLFPQPSPAELLAHFQTDDTDEKELEGKFESNRENVLSRVADYIQQRRQRGTILDVGCSTGLFLARLLRNPGWTAWGLELASASAQKAEARGVRIFRGDIHAAHFAENSFDVVSVLDAFYYFPQPHRELSEVRRVLKPDGLLVLELPLATARIWRTSKALGRLVSGSRRPLLQSSDHLFYFTPKSVAMLLQRCGFHVQDMRPLPGNRQADLPRDLTMRAYSLASSLLHRASGASIFLGPRFLVVATKIT
jgi:SAM-dependent methyltransferase